MSDSKKETDLGGTNYEVIQQRLSALGNTLDDKIKALNDKRLELFDSPEMEPIDRVRIRTQDSSVPRDIITIGDTLLFGFNVQKGMAKMELEDVLTLHTLQITQDGDKTKHTFLDLPKDDPRNFLQNPDFLRDFERLYNVYKKARLVQLRRVQPKNRPKLLLAVFQVGLKLTDVQVFRWQITADEKARYIDASGIEDNVLLPSHDFAWVPTTRNDHRTEGRHPHISILDEVFVETIGGDLTIKVEDNTEDGLGIYREPVDEQYQSLSDAEVLYKDLGALILLKIKPYREKEFRYFIFNTNTQTVERLDALGISCQQLPEQHGVIFPGGYYLQSGDLRILSDDVDGMQFQQTISSPNGEDVIYVYYAPETGHYSVLSYNMIRKEIRNNISCNGYCFFEDGRLSLFQAQEEATQNHYMQIWQTPYMSDNFAATLPPPGGDSFLSKIGNKDLVRGISEGYSITNAIQNQQPTVGIYEDLIERVKQMIKAYYWLDHKDTGNLQRELNTIQDTAELVLDEFHKVVALKKRAQEALQQTETHQEDLFTQFYGDWEDLDRFVQALSALRQQRGHLITLRDMRYIDAERIAILEAKVTDKIEELSQRTIQFLLKPEALDPYRTSIEEASERIDSIEKTTEVDEVRTRMAEISGGLDLLTEIVSSLDVDDPTARTSILQNIAAVMGLLNRSRALLEGHGKKLQESEGKAEFAAQFALFGQSVSSALATSDSPEKCDDNLSRLMVQLSELESRFSEFDVFFEQISAKQDEVREIFEARKQSLEDERQRRALNLQRAGERTVQNIIRRASSYDDLDALNAFFAGDSMVTKVRDTVERLRKLGDTVKADDLQSKLTTARDEATRTFRDKSDLYEDGNNIRLGNFLFSVNTQNFELTAIPRDGIMCLHLTGTDFFEPIDDAAFANTQAFWSQRLPSETEDVYRAEFLAATIFLDAQANRNGLSVDLLHEEYANENGFLPLVQRTAQDRYDEGYERGVHDADAALILEKLLALQSTTGNLRFSSHARAMAALFWAFGTERQQSALWSRRGQSLGRLRSTFQSSQALETFGRELSSSIQTFLETHNLLRTLSPDPAKDGPLLEEAGVYLAEELTKERPQFTISGAAQRLRDHFFSHLDKERARRHFEDDLRTFENDPSSLFHIAHSWLDAYAQSAPDDENVDDEQRSSVLEATILTLTKGHIDHSVSSALTSIDVQGLIGQHPRVRDNTLPLQLDTFTARLNDFIHNRVPAFNAYRRHLQEVLTSARERLRLDSIKPGILSSFVRNKLIQEVYFKIIGDNFSKQLGAEGENKRSDRQGLLLLISPPGYGKTTLMEYVANRLGLVFMKINGPALGHDTVSLDPAEAPNATARQEVNRLNMALEMGNNVMLYLDDIQHTHPEFLQKFISLCDGQRKIEGVWRGKTKTYDLRGKRFCVVMAGNPYTETGEAFQIPDMLANRADTYNLGDVLGGREDVFSLSYVENALVSNPTLAPLSNRDQNDTYALIRLAEGKEISPDDLSYAYPQQEIREITSVLQHLFTVRDVLFDVNATYIASAATDDDYRTEPPFKLQGSYRNMAKIAEKITPVHNHEEVEAIIDDHYRGEAQTLTIAAEANLLKLASLRDRMTPEEQERWHTICSEYQRRQVMGGGQNDPVARIAAPLGSLVQQLTEMQRSLSSNTLAPQLTAVGTSLQNIEQSLSANPLPTHLNTLNTSLQGIASSLQRDSLSPSLESLTEHLSLIAESIQNDRSLSSHLAGMRQTMQAIVQHLKTPPQPTTPTPQPTPQADLFAPLLESLQTSLQTMGTSIAEATTAAAQAANAATQTAERHIALPTAPPQPTTPTPTQNPTTPTQPGSFAQPEIRIVNEAPDNIRDVLTHQIEVLEWTLVPLVRTMTQNLQFSSESWTKLSEVLERVKQLNTHFNQGTPHISTTPPTSSPPPANYHHPNTQRPPQRSNLRPAPQRSTPAAPQHQHAPTHTRTPQPQHSPTPHQQRRSPHTTSAHPQPASTPHQHAGPSPYTQRPGPNVQRPSQARSAQHSTTYNAPPQPSQSSHQSTPANTHLRYPPPKRRPPTVYIPPNAKTNRSGSTQELPAIPKKPKKPE